MKHKLSFATSLPSQSGCSHQCDLRVNNPHDHLGLQQSVSQLGVLQQHVPRLLGTVLHTQLEKREIKFSPNRISKYDIAEQLGCKNKKAKLCSS